MRYIAASALLGALFAQSVFGHTPKERQHDLAKELETYFDPAWVQDIFNHKNLCAGYETTQERLTGGWPELEHRVLAKPSVYRGELFFRYHETLLRDTAGRFDDTTGTMPYVIVAILRIESDFGTNRAGVPVIRKLFERYHSVIDGPSGNRTRAAVMKNAILPFMQMAEANRWEVCEIRGSRAAAFGFPHFIPDSLPLAVDGDEDGLVDIMWSLPDAMASIGNFLTARGWKTSYRRAVFRYNPDERYVRIVLRYAAEIQKRIETPAP